MSSKYRTPEQHRAWMNAWYAKSPENRKKVKDRTKKFKADNPDYGLEWQRKNPERLMFKRAKYRAKTMGLEFSITVEDILIPDVCPVFGIPLFQNKGKRGPNSPSLERFDNDKGYTPENIRVISLRANTLKRNATFEEIRALARWVASGG